jgi:hypothetical protein
MSKIYDWFEERLEIQAIADDITSVRFVFGRSYHH